jgi:predicted thioesterase
LSAGDFTILLVPSNMVDFDLYCNYKQNELIVEIKAIRTRIPKKQFKEKIDNMVQKAKQISH